MLTGVGVQGYLGSEVPNDDKLGLDPFRIYKLLRPAAELERAASTLARKPILMRHVAVSATDHPAEDVCGAVGSDVTFDSSVVRSSLTLWTDAAIEAVESGTMRDVSCGYWFRADITPGTYQSTRFDGTMRDLAFNHLAIVIDGRVPGAMVGDAKPRNHEYTGSQTVSETQIIRRIQAIDMARAAVCPLVGDLSVGFDSADQVYVAAMEHLGRDCADIKAHAGVAKAIWPAFQKHHLGVSMRRAPAMDAKATTRRETMFPNAQRLNRGF